MVKSLLPPLNDDHAVAIPSTHGKWTMDENSILGRIANGLKDITIEQEVEDLISIPDVWARVAVVKNALFDDKHPLNYTVRGEWRGLLALFALMPYHGKNLETIPVNIQSLKNNPYQVPPNEEGVLGNFAEVLATITPGTTIAQGQNWSEIGIIKLDGKPVGLLTPNTIVSPARYYSESIPGGIDWFQTGKFIDPCEAANIQQEQFLVLIRFLDEMITGLQQTAMADKINFDGILGELTGFKEDCQKRISSSQSSAVDILNYKKFNVVLRVPQQPIYTLLQNIYEIDTGGVAAFDTLIKVRPELNSVTNGIILIDDEIPSGIGKAASDVRLWNTITVETLIGDKQAKKRIQKEVSDAGYLFLHPEELFTEKLCLPASSEKIMNHNDLLAKPYLLPFNPIVLSFMTASQLRNNFDIKDNGTSINVSLRLELQNHMGQKTEYVIRKEYLQSNIENRFELPTSAHIWPNFVHPAWSQYFMMYACNLQASIALRSVFSIQGLSKELDNFESSDQKIKALNQLKDFTVKMSNRLPLEETTNVLELHLTENPPEALVCDASMVVDLHEFIPSNERSAMGIILAGKPQEVLVNNDSLSFGIDFGTTNTCAYMRVNEDLPKEINFENRLYSPFSPIDDKEYLNYLLRDFIPSRNVVLPFQTISRDRNIGKNQGDISFPLPLWSALIYYVGDMRDGLNDILDPKQKPLHFNLKWSKAEADRERIEIYLAQVVLQCIAEGLARGADLDKINWSFSYPEAFTPTQLQNFRRLFKSGLRKALQPFNSGKNEVQTLEKSESLSSALYFSSFKNAPFTESVVTIDIGGGTSDISIWQNLNLLWRSSVTIAGQHILINYLNQNPNLIESLSSNDRTMQEAYELLSDIKSGGDPNALRNAIEIIVNSKSFAEAINSRFHIVDGQDNGRNLRLIAELALAGILFYAGQMVNHLTNQGLYDPSKTKQFSICLGGRASLLYKVLFSDSEDRNGLCRLFAAASNNTVDIDKVNFVFTDKPKHEVAHGLLVDQRGIANLDTSKRCYDVLLGEDIDVGGEVTKYNQSASDLDLDKEWRAISLTNMKQFADMLNANTGIVFEVSRQVENMIVSKINTNLVTAQEELQDAKKDGLDYLSDDMKGETSIIEPPFIVAIKEILERVSKKEINLLSKKI